MSTIDTAIRDQLNGQTTSGRKTDSTGKTYNAVFTDKKEQSVSVDDFLNLMVAQLKNQDFMNPVDDTQYVSQLAQFATMQQMQELAAYSKSNYAMSLVGKDVTAAKYSVGGTLQKESGPVQRVSLVDNEYKIYVNGTPFTFEQIMELNGISSTSNTPEKDVSKLPITVADVTADSVALSWPAATDNVGIADRITYTAYYSTIDSLSSVSEIETLSTAIGERDRKNLTKETIKGLYPDTTYYVNVVMTDGDGTKTAYKQCSFKTPAKEV